MIEAVGCTVFRPGQVKNFPIDSDFKWNLTLAGAFSVAEVGEEQLYQSQQKGRGK